MLSASDAETGDRFGWSVAVDGDLAIVGARWEDTGGANAGAAYLFRRDIGGADNWGEIKKLTASDAAAGDQFGRVGCRKRRHRDRRCRREGIQRRRGL